MRQLRLHDFQYGVRHHNTNAFECGDTVFLKSNPERELVVVYVNPSTVVVWWTNDKGKVEEWEFPPECLLHYEHVGIMVVPKLGCWKVICVN